MKEKIAKISKTEVIYKQKAHNHLNTLTKPIGSLGFLEELAVNIYAMCAEKRPFTVNPVFHFTIAGDHGIIQQNVTVYPQEVTRQMVHNFIQGGGAINVLCKEHAIDFAIVDSGCVGEEFPPDKALISRRICSGTKDASIEPAMSYKEVESAIFLGISLAEEKILHGYRMLTVGEMGIGNSTIATALCCAFLNNTAEEMTGLGAGIPEAMLAHKISVVQKILALHNDTITTGSSFEIARCVGGVEFAVIAGIILGASMHKIPIVIDGFIATAGYLIARAICEHVEDYVIMSHCSAEHAHKLVLERIAKRPILHLDMRLGEGTGAVLAVPIIRSAVALYTSMATFDSANISKEL